LPAESAGLFSFLCWARIDQQFSADEDRRDFIHGVQARPAPWERFSKAFAVIAHAEFGPVRRGFPGDVNFVRVAVFSTRWSRASWPDAI